MGKSTNRDNKLHRHTENDNARRDFNDGKHTAKKVGHREFKRIVGRNNEQKSLVNQLFAGGDLIITGDAGTGKTFVSSVCALDMMLNDKYPFKKLILIRPNQPLGPSVGMLKGDMMEKIWPWICPFVDAFDHRIDRNTLSGMIELGQIELVLVEHLRGRTFKDAIILVDEIQNMTDTAAKCLLTRKGEGSKMILMGDLEQCDLPKGETSALDYIDDIDEIADNRGIRRPYHYITLKQNERSVESAWWSQMNQIHDEWDFEIEDESVLNSNNDKVLQMFPDITGADQHEITSIGGK